MSTNGRPIRLSKNKAVEEFGIDSKTLTKRLRQYDVRPGKDNKFSILQICSAVFGDIDAEKLRLVREQADGQALKNAESRMSLVSAAEMKMTIERHVAPMVQIIQAAANLEHEDKAKLINQLREVGTALDGGIAQGNGSTTELPGEPMGRAVPVS